jgi:hypothetical protein
MVNVESQDLQEIIVSQPPSASNDETKAKEIKSKEGRPAKAKSKKAIKKPSEIDALFRDLEAEADLPSPRHLSRLESRVQELVTKMTHDVAIVNPHSHRGELTPRVHSEVTSLVEQMQKDRRLSFIRSTLCIATVITVILATFVVPSIVMEVLTRKGLIVKPTAGIRSLPMP